MDLRVAAGAESSDGEGHGNAMVGARVDLCAVELLIAGDVESVFVFGEFRSHGPEVFDDEGDAIRFFDAEFFCVADGDSFFGVGSDGGEDGKLVDDLRGEGSANVHAAGAVGGAVDLNTADEFAIVIFDVQDLDAASECGNYVEERGSGGVHADGVEDEVGVREEKSCAEEEGCRREIAGDGCVDRFECLTARDAELFAFAVERCAECAEGVLGVIAGADGLGEAGGAFGLQAGEEDCGFDLRAWDWGVEVDGVQRAAVDGDGSVAFDEIDACSHLHERFADALHGAEGEGVVTDEGKGVRVRRDETTQHTHRRAGVATVKWGGGLYEGSRGAGDGDGFVLVADDGCAEGFHTG